MKCVGALVWCHDCRSRAQGLSAMAWALITLCLHRKGTGWQPQALFSLCPEFPWIHDLDSSSLYIFLLSGSWPQLVLTQTLKSLQRWDRGSTYSALETAVTLGVTVRCAGISSGQGLPRTPSA